VPSEAPKAASLFTPGAMLTRSAVKLVLGMFRRISLVRVTDAVSVDFTSTVGAWAMTVTLSSREDALSVNSTDRVVVVVRRMFSRTTVANPWSSALTWYEPGGSAGNR